VFDHIGLLQIVTVSALTLGLYKARRFLSVIARSLVGEHGPGAGDRSQRGYFILLEITEVTLAAIFFVVGGAKLIGQPDMIVLFREIGVGDWFRYLTGVVEVSGALLLVVPFLSGASAIALGAVMIVASLIELFVLHRPPVAALACLSAHTFVAWSRVANTSAALGGHVETVSARSGLRRGLAARWTFPHWIRVRDPIAGYRLATTPTPPKRRLKHTS